ncbi:MAG: (2Fe-2S) ferredoxin domain-containing protein, partial [Desulfobacterales bacterium]
MTIKSPNDLSALKEKIKNEKSELSKKTQVIVYQGTCGFASGAQEVLEALKKEIYAKNLTDVAVLEHSCMGCCYLEPYMSVTDPEGIYTLYGYLTPEKVKQIVETHLIG